MPKLLVLAAGAERADAVADAVAQGARAVRFTEVDLRRVPSAGPDKESPEAGPAKSRTLDADEKLTEYDALVLVGDADGVQALAGVVDGQERLTDLVGAFVAAEEVPAAGRWSLGDALARRGVILLSGSDDPAAVGSRAAKVAGWVRHAKGHEHGGGGHHHH
jgi:hypothetical protein